MTRKGFSRSIRFEFMPRDSIASAVFSVIDGVYSTIRYIAFRVAAICFMGSLQNIKRNNIFCLIFVILEGEVRAFLGVSQHSVYAVMIYIDMERP